MMPSQFCISVRFLQPYAHGRGDGDEPEWPPSPLRLFQALAAAAAARWNERTRLEYAVPALEWLARQPAPTVVATAGTASDVKYRLYVPDNVADKVAKAWRAGNANASIADYRTEKDVRPTHLAAKDGEFAAIHYLYPVADADAEFATHKETLRTAARSVTHLGWGVDMVAGNAEVLEETGAKPEGERRQPTMDGSGTQLRVPRAGTLAALMNKHADFLGRLQGDGFRPVPPLTTFATVGYRRDTDSAERPWVAFRVMSADPDAPNPAFDMRRARDVAAWVRHAVGQLQSGWPFPDSFAAFVHGHDANGRQLTGAGADARFMYLPLPSIEHRGERGESVGAIRRVLIAAPPGCEDRIDWLRRRLPGQELREEPEKGDATFGLLSELGAVDWVRDRYVGESRVWSTVTPVVLPGYDDPDGIRKRLRDKDPAKPMTAEQKNSQVAELERRTRRLLESAFRHAGFSDEVVGGLQFEWRNVGFRAGVELASQYNLPRLLAGARYHVRVRFAHPIRGPLAVGAGRYRGLGTFVAEGR